MLRAVLDASVYSSALLRPAGPPGQVVESYIREQSFLLVLSTPVVEEVLAAIAYPRIRSHLRDGIDPALWLEDLIVLAELVTADPPWPGVCEDPDDDKYLAAALTGCAGFVVTGDQRFLALGKHEEVQIVTPRRFLELLRSEETGET